MTILSGQYIIPVVVPFVVAILALAFPLMLDASSKVGDKYKSSIMTSTFHKELSFLWFLVMLVSSLVALFLYFLELPAPYCFRNNWLVANSAVLFVYVSAVFLVISLLCLSHTIHIYYSHKKLLRHLIRRYKCWDKWYKIKNKAKRKPNNEFDKSDFIAISKLMNFSIENADEELAREVYSFFCEAFIKFRIGKKGEEIDYPEEFYNAIFEASELLCRRQYKTLSYYNDGSLYEFFIDSFQETKISPKTIRFIWMCAMQNIHYEHYDFLFGLWKKTYQQVGLVVSCKPSLQDETIKFTELSHILCSYLLHAEQFSELAKVMRYTQFAPPKYVLTPSSVQEVIDSCLIVESHNNYQSPLFPVYYESLYPHPGVEGVYAGNIIQQRLYKFYAVCFLFQYRLLQTFATSGYSDTIHIGTSTDEKKNTQTVVLKLRENVEEILKNKKLLNSMKLDTITFDQMSYGHKSPKQWFDDILTEISDSVLAHQDEEEKAAEIPQEVVSKFNETVCSSFRTILDQIRPFLCSNKSGKKECVSLAWRHDINRKSHVLQSINFAEVCGGSLATEYHANFWLPLLKMNMTTYSLKKDEVLKTAFSWKKHKGLVILVFGIRFDEEKLRNEGLLKKENGQLLSATGIEVLRISSYPLPPVLSESVVLIKRNDLPYQLIEPLSDETINELGLSEIDTDNHLYTSVIDFHLEKWNTIKQKYIRQNNSEADKYAMFCTYINSKLWYNSKAKLIRLSVYNQFLDRGKPQLQEEVVDIWKRSRKTIYK